MKIGTKSLFFGAHQFIIHPIFVYIAWCKLYGIPFNPLIYLSILIHDWGYFGCSNMDGEEGKKHPLTAARFVLFLTESPKWFNFTYYHSRSIAKKDNVRPSKLCYADKLGCIMEPYWLYLPRVWLTGELKEYMDNAKNHIIYDNDPRVWYKNLQSYLRKWVEKNKNHYQ